MTKLVIDIEGNTMVPLDTDADLRLLVRGALHNIDQFDMTAFGEWLRTQPDGVQQLATRCPPNRLYLVRGLASPAPLYGYIDGYADGSPAVAVVSVLGHSDAKLGVPADGLEDVTDRVR